jgi:hypothetical protein
MTTSKFQAMTAVAAFATLFYVGCGDDDGNEKPGAGGSGATTGGKASTGGTTAKGGGAATAGGQVGTSGGATGKGGGAAQGGAGGDPVIPSEGGSGGVPIITPGEGGSGGAGGSDALAEPCTTAHFDATAACYSNCAPTKTNASEQFLNHCSEAGAQCTKFTATLTKLGANGELPPLP